MKLNHIRYGNGQPLLLIHGIGGTWKSWMPVLDKLATHREIIAIDLPGHGKTPPLEGPTTIATLADAVMGARLVLELARRGGVLGTVVSLDPGGFWESWQRHLFYGSIAASIRLVRGLQFAMPVLTNNIITRSILLAQFSERPWNIPPHLALTELRSYASSPVFNELLYNLAYGEEQKGAARGSLTKPLIIGWGRQDRVCFPSQSKKALHLFPDAHVYWFNRCGHFPHWDKPAETTSLILRATATPKVKIAEEESLL